MVHRIFGGENHIASRRKCQSNEFMAGNLESGLAVRRDLHNAALARERSSHIQIARSVKSQALWASRRESLRR